MVSRARGLIEVRLAVPPARSKLRSYPLATHAFAVAAGRKLTAPDLGHDDCISNQRHIPLGGKVTTTMAMNRWLG
jgi:hypothetical protein